MTATGTLGSDGGGWETLAPAKINACLFVGPTRESDGRHELITVMENLDLADRVSLTWASSHATDDVVACPGVIGPNLALDAVRAFRARTGWDAPPVHVSIEKHIPIAGGMAGGSADAAAALRLCAAAAGIDDGGLLEEIAVGLGADVPSQVRGGRLLAQGAGERLTSLGPSRDRDAVIVVTLPAGLSAGAVYTESDRRSPPRSAESLHALRTAVLAAEGGPGLRTAGLAVNDLQPAAIGLCPAVGVALAVLRQAGCEHVMVSGSGPTTLGFLPPSGVASVTTALDAYAVERGEDDLLAQARYIVTTPVVGRAPTPIAGATFVR